MRPELYALCAALALLFTGIPVVNAHDKLQIPDIGDSGATALSRADEARIGSGIVRNLRHAGRIIDDPQVNDYLDRLGFSLVSVADQDNPQFNFFMIKESSINAFALPGGFIGFHYGLVLASESESELASVMAHEIAHVTQRHHARQFEFANKKQAPLLAALIAGIILAASGNPEVGQAAIAGATGGSLQMQLNFTRANEKEADRIGIGLLEEAGYNPASMIDFFTKMQREARLYGSQVPEFLLTHPVSEDRMADARHRMSQLEARNVPSSKAYYLLKERVRMLIAEDDKQLLDDYKKRAEVQDYVNKEAFDYGYLLALHKNRQYRAANKLLMPLLNADPTRIAYILENAELKTALKQHKQASQIYKNALQIYPANRTLAFAYAQNLLQQKHYTRAIKLIRKQTRQPYAHPDLYKLLSQAESRLGHKANAHEAMAEYYYQIGQNHQAMTQLSLALKVPHLDFYQESRLTARRNIILDEIKVVPNAS